jgi:hypothetical protein
MDGFLQKATQFAEQQFENSESGSANRTASHRIASHHTRSASPPMEPNHQTGNPPRVRYTDASSHRPTECRFAATPGATDRALNVEDKLVLIHA